MLSSRQVKSIRPAATCTRILPLCISIWFMNIAWLSRKTAEWRLPYRWCWFWKATHRLCLLSKCICLRKNPTSRFNFLTKSQDQDQSFHVQRSTRFLNRQEEEKWVLQQDQVLMRWGFSTSYYFSRTPCQFTLMCGIIRMLTQSDNRLSLRITFQYIDDNQIVFSN